MDSTWDRNHEITSEKVKICASNRVDSTFSVNGKSTQESKHIHVSKAITYTI